MSLAGLYNRNYGPYEWKHDTFGFDLLNIKPWLDQVNASKDDLSFYDICVRYVASLQDSHDEFILPSDFEAYLPLTADIYDGKVLIDRIDRSLLPSRTYPFQVGDELVSVDGVAVSDWITKLPTPYSVNGSANPVSRSRLAVGTMLDRYQGWYPLATQVGDSASVVIRRQNSNVETYTITWQILGTALRSEGPLQNARLLPPRSVRISQAERALRPDLLVAGGAHPIPGVLGDGRQGGDCSGPGTCIHGAYAETSEHAPSASRARAGRRPRSVRFSHAHFQSSHWLQAAARGTAERRVPLRDVSGWNDEYRIHSHPRYGSGKPNHSFEPVSR